MKAALPLSVLALISAAALMTGCITGGSGGVPASTGGMEKVVGPYTIADGKIITPARIDTSYECFDDSLSTYLDTVAAESLSYELTGNSLILYEPGFDTLASGAVSQLVINAMRVGSGSGLEGAWTYNTYKSRIVSGTPTAADLDTLAKRDSLINHGFLDATAQVRFSNGMISVYIDVNTAEQFLSNWNGEEFGLPPEFADSATYDVEVKVISKYVVQLKGRKNGEVVTLTIDSNGNRTYTSSVPAHTEYHYTEGSKSCPNNQEPGWYYDFLSPNGKKPFPNGKKGATREIRSKTGIGGFFRPFPLKAP